MRLVTYARTSGRPRVGIMQGEDPGTAQVSNP